MNRKKMNYKKLNHESSTNRQLLRSCIMFSNLTTVIGTP
jgi:hypothetical protein